MVTASLPARPSRRAAGLAVTAGAVFVLAGGAYADGATQHGAPEGRAGASDVLMSPVARTAVRRAPELPPAEVSEAPAHEPAAAPSPALPEAGDRPARPGPSAGPQARPSSDSPTPPPRTSVAPPAPLVPLTPLTPLAPDDRRPAPSHSDDPSRAARQAAGPSASPSGKKSPLAGRQAGEGRARPGRSLSPMELARSEDIPGQDEQDEQDTDPGELPPATSPPGAFPEPHRTTTGKQTARQALDGSAVHQVRQMSLGAGIALVGLGLGFLGFRMRRTN